jgi:hypothetical protein
MEEYIVEQKDDRLSAIPSSDSNGRNLMFMGVCIVLTLFISKHNGLMALFWGALPLAFGFYCCMQQSVEATSNGIKIYKYFYFLKFKTVFIPRGDISHVLVEFEAGIEAEDYYCVYTKMESKKSLLCNFLKEKNAYIFKEKIERLLDVQPHCS